MVQHHKSNLVLNRFWNICYYPFNFSQTLLITHIKCCQELGFSLGRSNRIFSMCSFVMVLDSWQGWGEENFLATWQNPSLWKNIKIFFIQKCLNNVPFHAASKNANESQLIKYALPNQHFFSKKANIFCFREDS